MITKEQVTTAFHEARTRCERWTSLDQIGQIMNQYRYGLIPAHWAVEALDAIQEEV